MSDSDSYMVNCGTGLYPLICPPNHSFHDGRNGVCYANDFSIRVCSTYAVQNVEDAKYTLNLNDKTNYLTIDQSLAKSNVQASIEVAGLSLACITFCNLIVLTPGQKRHTTIFRALAVGLLCSIAQQSAGTWVWTSSVRVAAYPLLTNDWASTDLSTSYRAALIIMHAASVMALGCVQVALYAQCKGLLTRLKIKYPNWVHTVWMSILVLFSAVAFVYQVAFQGYLLFWYGFPPYGTQFSDIPGQWWYFVLHLGSSVSVCASLGLWTLVITQNVLNTIWERREALFSIDSLSGGDWRMPGAPVGSAMTPARSKKSKASNVFESVMTLIGLVSCQTFVVPLLIIVLVLVYFNEYQFDGLLVTVFLALLPVGSVLSNVSGQGPRTVESEIVQRKGYPMHQFHPLPGAESSDGRPHCSRREQIAELAGLDSEIDHAKA